jgi:ABC-type transporter Mla subunit MlaD
LVSILQLKRVLAGISSAMLAALWSRKGFSNQDSGTSRITHHVDSKAKLSPNNNMKIDDVHEEA